MFYGTWIRVIDGRGRITIPEDFVEEFETRVVILPDSNCILLYPEKEIGRFSDDEIIQIKVVPIRGRVRVTIPKEFRDRFFQGCKKVKWEGWRDYFRITSCNNV